MFLRGTWCGRFFCSVLNPSLSIFALNSLKENLLVIGNATLTNKLFLVVEFNQILLFLITNHQCNEYNKSTAWPSGQERRIDGECDPCGCGSNTYSRDSMYWLGKDSLRHFPLPDNRSKRKYVLVIYKKQNRKF